MISTTTAKTISERNFEPLVDLSRTVGTDAVSDALAELGRIGVSVMREKLPIGWLLNRATGYELGRSARSGGYLLVGVRDGFALRPNADPADYRIHYERGHKRGRKRIRRQFIRPARRKIERELERVVAEKIREQIERRLR